MPTPEGHVYKVGDEVRFDRREWHSSRAGIVSEGTIGVITKVGKESSIVKAMGSYNEEGKAWSNHVHITPNDPNLPRPRKLGEKPEGDEFIGSDHPGIQWLFEDMGKLAETKGHCREYDHMADQLGIPGRERNFTITVKRGLLSLPVKVKARSRVEAEGLAQAEFAKALDEAVKEQSKTEAVTAD